ncbi:MAG: hypothetical protein HND52_19550 [Ignavibacteriae bacterium]|nr:hypothetical protein [Ignavibacteriota bacterium]NOH00163.1 hypothetical protein [Ignavibacteriota bacterium]
MRVKTIYKFFSSRSYQFRHFQTLIKFALLFLFIMVSSKNIEAQVIIRENVKLESKSTEELHFWMTGIFNYDAEDLVAGETVNLQVGTKIIMEYFTLIISRPKIQMRLWNFL